MLEHRKIKVDTPDNPRELYVTHYQTFNNGIPGDTWKAYSSKADFELDEQKDMIINKYRVPENEIDKLISLLRYADDENEKYND
jgi:hypothetical protein